MPVLYPEDENDLAFDLALRSADERVVAGSREGCVVDICAGAVGKLEVRREGDREKGKGRTGREVADAGNDPGVKSVLYDGLARFGCQQVMKRWREEGFGSI